MMEITFIDPDCPMKMNVMTRFSPVARCILSMFAIVFVLTGAAFAERVCVSADSASSRRGPGEKYDIVWDKMDKNYPLEVLHKRGDWYYVKDYAGDTSWINRAFVKTWDTVITKKDRVNVRSGPGSENQAVFMVDSGVPFRVIRRNGEWLEVQHADGDTGWINERMVW